MTNALLLAIAVALFVLAHQVGRAVHALNFLARLAARRQQERRGEAWRN